MREFCPQDNWRNARSKGIHSVDQHNICVKSALGEGAKRYYYIGKSGPTRSNPFCGYDVIVFQANADAFRGDI